MWDETHCMAGHTTEDMYWQFPLKYSVPSCTIHVATNFLQPVFVQKCCAGHQFTKSVPFMLSAQTLSSCTCVQSCLLSVSPLHFILPLQSVSCCKFLFWISISEFTVVGCFLCNHMRLPCHCHYNFYKFPVQNCLLLWSPFSLLGLFIPLFVK